jgi:FMN phosphatase YigB (HAD superfamily)
MKKQKPYILFDPYPTIYDKQPLVAPCNKKYRMQEIAGSLFAVFDNKKLYVDKAGTPQARVRFEHHDEWNSYGLFDNGVCYLAARRPPDKVMGGLEHAIKENPAYVQDLLKDWKKAYENSILNQEALALALSEAKK